MTLTVLALVLAAAVTHAAWNTWLKVSGDRLVTLATISIGWLAIGMGSLAWVGFPAVDAWPYLLASAAIHAIYALLVIEAYARIDLSVTYPIARGTGPVVVAVFSTAVLGDTLGAAGFASVVLIVVGVLWLGMPRAHQTLDGVLLSLAIGCFIGTYTLLDGLGGRLGNSPHAYVAWLLILTAIPIVATAVLRRGEKIAGIASPVLARGLIAGFLSGGAYWVVVWAMSVAPMGLVAAMRETSVIFAALFGGTLLRERVRWGAVMLVFAGIALTRLA